MFIKDKDDDGFGFNSNQISLPSNHGYPSPSQFRTSTQLSSNSASTLIGSSSTGTPLRRPSSTGMNNTEAHTPTTPSRQTRTASISTFVENTPPTPKTTVLHNYQPISQQQQPFFGKDPEQAMSQKQKFTMVKTKWIPKLQELALREISKYATSQSELLRWRQSTATTHYKRALNALINGGNGETCGFCDEVVVEPVAELLEWWDWKDCKSLPVKRKFCCKRCALGWWEGVLCVLET
ncbi:unnamed protein product [Ambrosiozyma monospora]|uniref:Unnamed protein product n=1 Tax=Ambrosiozyma monospora TaxID=43982 RepID=A0ACB5UAH5_AMBMO|nr:unnamed protein product [Ambrosiozyma monospora]